MRLPYAGFGHKSTLNHALSVRQTSRKSAVERPTAVLRGEQTASPSLNLRASSPRSQSPGPDQPPRREEDGSVEAAGLGRRSAATRALSGERTVAGSTADGKGSSEACQNASDRLPTWLGRELGGGGDESHSYLKLMLTLRSSRSIRVPLRVKLNP